MSDDIVTRLRAKAEHRSPINQSLVMHIRQPIMAEAADEIERLRAAILHVRWHLCPPGECEMCDTYEEVAAHEC